EDVHYIKEVDDKEIVLDNENKK
ncbi:MAG: LapA family protein, partial [Clostridium sp.]|nr:LapA family protein [Clostridium sp.]